MAVRPAAGAAAQGSDELLARRLWQHVEVVHAVVYFAPEVADAVAATGIEGWWAGYVAGRAAPLGKVPPEVVQALFHGFAPSRIRRGVPAAWDHVRPELLVGTRRAAVGAALARLLGSGGAGHGEPAPAIELLDTALAGADPAGRALYAAHAALPDATDDWERLWQRCTAVREHRGDGHVAALVGEGLGGAAANRLAVARGTVPLGDQQRRNRGWSDAEWAAAGDELVRRGLLRPGGEQLSAAGQRMVHELEARTDAAAVGPVQALGPDGVQRLLAVLAPMVERIVASGTVTYPNAMGLTRPAQPSSTPEGSSRPQP